MLKRLLFSKNSIYIEVVFVKGNSSTLVGVHIIEKGIGHLIVILEPRVIHITINMSHEILEF